MKDEEITAAIQKNFPTTNTPATAPQGTNEQVTGIRPWPRFDTSHPWTSLKNEFSTGLGNLGAGAISGLESLANPKDIMGSLYHAGRLMVGEEAPMPPTEEQVTHPEFAVGQMIPSIALAEAGGSVGDRIPSIDEATSRAVNTAASVLRRPATSRQSLAGRPGTIKQILPPRMQQWTVPDWVVPKGELGTATNPGPFLDIPMKTKPATIGKVGSEAQEAGYYPPVTKVPIRPEPPYKLTPESVPGPDTAGKGNLLSPLAKAGDPRAAMELKRRGRGVLFVPAETDYPAPRSITKIPD